MVSIYLIFSYCVKIPREKPSDTHAQGDVDKLISTMKNASE